MGSKLALEEKGKFTTFLNNRKKHRHECVDGQQSKPCSCSSSSLVSTHQNGTTKCKEKVIEFLCSCCLLCVCCPLAAVCCCCIKTPCRICKQVLRRAWKWASSSCGSRRRVFAEYSSFSDIDSDVAYGKFKASDSGDRTHKDFIV